ncbi:MAG: tetratricopeptide repeat protein [Candidatus Hodarchaeota archaeon]
MSRTEGVLYPPEEILNPIVGKTDYEYVILWMLSNNNICEWSDFTAEISESTLSGNLKKLLNKNYIEKPEKGKYRITPAGRERYSELLYDKKSDEKKLRTPPDKILKKRNYDHWILWMLYNNNSCIWSDFKQDPLSINQSSLSNNLNSLIDDGLVAKENKEYMITPRGRKEYSRILKFYDLDRQSILEQESKRIEEITGKTSRFFRKYRIEDDELKFRFLNYILKLPYSKVEPTLNEEEDFNKILLFLSMNHPNRYPNYISPKEFSKNFGIKENKLTYYIDEIVQNNIYSIDFFVLKNGQGRSYYFQKNETIEKVLNALVEKHITKFTYLNKFYETITIDPELLVDNILDDICGNLFDEKLKPSLKAFLPGYIRYLAYKIETEKKLVGSGAKLEGFVWQSIFEEFQTFEPSNIPIPGKEDEFYYGLDHYVFSALDVMRMSKLSFIETKEIQETYYLNTVALFKKIGKALSRNKVSKAKELFQENTTKLKTINQLIIKDIITTRDNKLDESIEITNEIIEKYPEDFIGYLFQSMTYFLMDNYGKSLEIVEKGLQVASNALLIALKAKILVRTLQLEQAIDLIDKALSQYPDHLLLLKTKYIIYINHWISTVKDYNDPLNLIEKLITLKPNDKEILLLKSLYYCVINKYKEAKRLIKNEINLNNFEKNPEIDTTAYYILAYSYLARGKYDKSLEIANLILTLYSDHPISFFTKALVFGYNLIHRFSLKEQTVDKFTDLIKQTISLDPITYNKTKYLLFQTHILNGVGKDEEALESINKAIDLIPTLNSLLIRKSYYLINSEKESEALALIDELSESRPTIKKHLLLQKSYILVHLKQYEEALTVVEKGIKLDPKDMSFLNNKTIILGYLGRRKEAIEAAEELISRFPKNGNCFDTYGEILMALGDYENAIEKLKEALELEPTGWYAFHTCLKMGACYKELGKLERALEYYEKARKITEKMHPRESRNSLQKAEKLISEIMVLLGESKNPE